MAGPGETVEVLLPVALERTYTYRVPFGLSLAPGDVVQVPLAGREMIGVVWEGDGGLGASSNRLRPVVARLDAPPLRSEMRRFIEWVSGWTLVPRGMVMRMALRSPEPPEEKARMAYRRAGPEPERLTPARRRVLAALADGFAHERRALIDAAGVSPTVLDGLVDERTLEVLALPPAPVAPTPDPAFATTALNGAQAAAARSLVQAVQARGFAATLLE